jgi:hypothetical protein
MDVLPLFAKKNSLVYKWEREKEEIGGKRTQNYNDVHIFILSYFML